jgi:hypothetical protein
VAFAVSAKEFGIFANAHQTVLAHVNVGQLDCLFFLIPGGCFAGKAYVYHCYFDRPPQPNHHFSIPDHPCILVVVQDTTCIIVSVLDHPICIQLLC